MWDVTTESGGNLWRQLRRSRRRRKRRFPSEDRRGQISDATPIEERGKGAENRKKRGHWERDCMIGKDRKNAVIAMVDRKSRYNVFSKIKQKLAVKVTARTVSMLGDLPLRSITNDRGHEFADHKRLRKKLGVKVFFCTAHSSWQRGTNENRIGVLRQYLPKGTDISKLHWKTLRKYQNEMNHRPMKCLDWRTPHEVMFDLSCTADS
jgi:IS30 family transposase